MARLKIRYPLGEAVCPVCAYKFNRLRWWAVYCSARCRRLDHARKALGMPQNASDASCQCDDLRSEVDRLTAENKMLRQRLSGAGPIVPFKYDEENQEPILGQL